MPEYRRNPNLLIGRSPEEQWLCSPELAVSAAAGVAPGSVSYPEAARTAAALYVQNQLNEGRCGDRDLYDEFVARQPAQKRLTYQTYRRLVAFCAFAMPDDETFDAAFYINRSHDVFKHPEGMRAVGLNPETDSHDEALRRVFLPEYHAALVKFLPTYATPGMFTQRQRRLIAGVHTAGFNFARFVQMQTSLDEVSRLADIAPDVLKLIIAHGIHDVGGAMGHKDVEYSLTLDEPTAERLLDAAEALLYPDQGLTPTDRMGLYMGIRSDRLGIAPPAISDGLLAWSSTYERLALATFLRCNTPEECTPLLAAYQRLPQFLRSAWGSSQNYYFVHAPSGRGALGMDYAPAFLRAAIEKDDEDGLYLGLGYFLQIVAQAMATEVDNAAVAGSDAMPHDRTYDQINFYHAAKWFADARGNIADATRRAAVIVRCSGRTLTPMLVDPGRYNGPERQWPLAHPDRYKVRGTEL